jgi:hypothetical protein
MVNSREIAADYRLAHWARIIQERTESGLSIKEFCKSHALRQNAYFYWQRKLRQLVCDEIAAAGGLAAPAGWTVALPVRSETAAASPGLTIGIGKCCVFATSETDEALLAKVCKVLVGLC